MWTGRPAGTSKVLGEAETLIGWPSSGQGEEDAYSKVAKSGSTFRDGGRHKASSDGSGVGFCFRGQKSTKSGQSGCDDQ